MREKFDPREVLYLGPVIICSHVSGFQPWMRHWKLIGRKQCCPGNGHNEQHSKQKSHRNGRLAGVHVVWRCLAWRWRGSLWRLTLHCVSLVACAAAVKNLTEWQRPHAASMFWSKYTKLNISQMWTSLYPCQETCSKCSSLAFYKRDIDPASNTECCWITVCSSHCGCVTV